MKVEFDFFYKWVRENFNIDLDAYKEQQLQRRINTVMRNSGAKNLKEYTKILGSDKEQKYIFLDYITINVTEFFRNRDIFEDFESVLINDIARENKNLEIWSAACSIGSEPYSIGIILDKYKLLNKASIVATDIDENILKKAKNGVYKEFELKNLTNSEIDRYFTKKDKEYEISSKLKDVIDFKKHDLILDRYQRGFHAIVCRNVTIYFKNETKDEIYKKMNDSLVKGGILFTGATESIYNPEKFGFEKLSTFIYKKI